MTDRAVSVLAIVAGIVGLGIPVAAGEAGLWHWAALLTLLVVAVLVLYDDPAERDL